MVPFVDAHRDVYGVEPICAVGPIAPSTYFLEQARQADPTRRPAWAQRDDALQPAIQRVWDEPFQVYGPRKVWKQLRREGVRVARCTVRRLLCAMGLAGALRGRTWITTTHAGAGPHPANLVERQFTATRPNQLWVSDFTYVATWSGFVYTAFVVDVLARRIVGWRVSASLRTDFVLDALEQAIHARGTDALSGLVHHSDRSPIRLDAVHPPPRRRRDRPLGREPGGRVRQRPRRIGDGALQNGGDPPAGTVAESGGGGVCEVAWVDWFNTRRLLGPIGDVPLAEFEAQYYAQAAVA